MTGLHVPEIDSHFNCREKIYPDGTVEVLVCDRPIFTDGGWESEKNNSVARGKRRDAPPSAADLERSARRASGKIRDLALCNAFQTFVTLTLDKTQIDRYDRAAVVKKMSTWCDNHVRRDGLRYVLVPELHKDGALHFHGFFGWSDPAEKNRWCRDSGTISVLGRKAPVRVRSDRHRASLLARGGQVVYNLPAWTLGFTTAIDLYGDYHQAVTYVCKYIRKQIQGPDAGRICGRWYYHGGCDGKPRVHLSNQEIRNFLSYPGAYRFDVPEAGASFVRVMLQSDLSDIQKEE